MAPLLSLNDEYQFSNADIDTRCVIADAYRRLALGINGFDSNLMVIIGGRTVFLSLCKPVARQPADDL